MRFTDMADELFGTAEGALPAGVRAACRLDGVIEAVGSVLPLGKLGLGWVCPAVVGFIVGLIVHFARKKEQKV